MRRRTKLRTVDHVIDALGGTKATADLFKTQMQPVSNWRARGQFPSDRYVKFQQILAERGLTAPAKLWGQHS